MGRLPSRPKIVFWKTSKKVFWMRKRDLICDCVRCGRRISRGESETNAGLCHECFENETLETAKPTDYDEE